MFKYMSIPKIIKGLQQDKESLEYKEAIIGAQRLGAPAAAACICLMAIFILTVMVVAGNGPREKEIPVMVEEVIEPQELEEIPPPPEDVPPPDTEVISDENFVSLNEAPIGEVVPDQPITPNPPVQLVNSPVKMKGISSRGSGGGGLGVSTRMAGDMVGTLYDLKRSADGKKRDSNYWKELREIVNASCSPSSLAPYFKVPKRVYLPYLFVPQQSADEGPRAFGVSGLMEPKGWIAIYEGQVQPAESGEYRLAGFFDDVLIVLINGKVVLDASWIAGGGATDWKPKENVGKHRTFVGDMPLAYSDWISFDAGRADKIELIVGERPGGKIGGLLLVQKKGVEYKTEGNGRPILPVFATARLSFKDKDTLGKFAWKIDPEAPRMNTAGRKSAQAVFKDTIEVDTGDL